MTKEQIEKLGITFVEGMTDDDVFEAISKRKGELEAEKSKFEEESKKHKGLVDKYSSEIKTLKDEAKAKLSVEEQAKLKYEEMEKEIANLKREKSVSEKVAKYLKLGYEEGLAKKVAEGEIEGKDVSEYHAQFIKAREEAIKQELMKNNPEIKGGNDGKPKYTKEDFKAGRISMAQLNELKDTDPATYKAIIGE